MHLSLRRRLTSCAQDDLQSKLIAFLFFCSFLLKIRPKCSAYSTPSSFVVSSPCWWNDHRLLCRCLTFIIFLSLSFAVGKLDDLCTRQCDGCNIKGTVLPLRQPRRRKPCHCGRRGLSLADITQCLWRGGGGGSNCNHCAIVVGGGSAWARKLLTFFFFSPFSRSARLTAEGSGKRDGIIKRDTFSFVPAKLFAHSVDFCPVGWEVDGFNAANVKLRLLLPS